MTFKEDTIGNNGSVTIAVNDFIHSLYAYKNISLYDANHVFDEEKSVRWNREEVERLNNSYDNRLSEAYTQARSEAAALSARIATGSNSEKLFHRLHKILFRTICSMSF